jgi:hypothetical protein
MKTVPVVRLADTTNVAALPDLPEEVRLAMADICRSRSGGADGDERGRTPAHCSAHHVGVAGYIILVCDSLSGLETRLRSGWISGNWSALPDE